MRKVEFAGYIPEALYDRFIQRFSMHGSTTWVINMALRRFMDEVERSPDFEEQMLRAIRDSTTSNKESV